MPGYHYMTDEEIAGSLQNEPEEEEEDEEEATGAQRGPSLAAGLEAISTCLRLIDNVGEPLAEHYEGLRIMRIKILKLQDAKQVQQKISSFFKPLTIHLFSVIHFFNAINCFNTTTSSASLHIVSDAPSSKSSSRTTTPSISRAESTENLATTIPVTTS